jgi:hypothetical protein
LLPYVNRVTGPLIERFLTAARLPLRITLGILTFLFYESITEMMRHQEKGSADDHFARMEALKGKFRAERNFYLFAFTFTIFIIILRLDVILNNYRLSKVRVEELEQTLGVKSGLHERTASKLAEKAEKTKKE